MLLKVENICKSFGGNQALSNASFALESGQIHALVGANGAGKSTLSNVITGRIIPDSGRIFLNDSSMNFRSPRDAISKGIAMVTQQLSLVPDLSVAENIFLPELARKGRFRHKDLVRRTKEILRLFKGIDPDIATRHVNTLPTAHHQIVEIAKALAQDAKIIIFDEPTTRLTPHEVENLFEIMRSLADSGRGLVFVSHRMEEIFTIADTVTVLLGGKNTAMGEPLEKMSQAQLIRKMIGRDLAGDIYPERCFDNTKPEPVLEVRGLTSNTGVQDVSFTLHKGEILGLAGLVGAGRSEVARTLFGLDKMVAGEIKINGTPFIPSKPACAMERGMSLLPEDRTIQGMIKDFSVFENTALSSLVLSKSLMLPKSLWRKTVSRLLSLMRLETGCWEDNILTLSGGMQQKAIIARSLLIEPQVLIVDEPTQGVDIGTRSEIYALLSQMAAQGLAILFISSDFEEVLGVSDRVLVLNEGKIAADVSAELLDKEKMTMFAVPRSSSDNTHRLLTQMSSRYGGDAFWVYVDNNYLYCFNKVAAGREISTGFSAGQVSPVAQTCLSWADRSKEGVWQTTDQMASIIVPVTSKQGHHMGWIGLCVGQDCPDRPEPETITQMVAQTY